MSSIGLLKANGRRRHRSHSRRRSGGHAAGQRTAYRFPVIEIFRPSAFLAGVACLLAVSFFGGDVAERSWQLNLVVASGFVALAAALAQGRAVAFSAMPASVRVLLVLVVVVPLLQLVPLPPSWSQHLPGRALEWQILDAVGAAGRWRPLSLEPLQTAMALLMLAPMAALFMLGLRATRGEAFLLLALLVVLVVGAALIGLTQYASSGRTFDFYQKAYRGPLLGYFTNRNHMALYMAVGMLAGGGLVRWVLGRTSVSMLATGAWSFLLLCVIIGTASRAGFALGCLAGSIAVIQCASLRRTNILKTAIGGSVVVAVLVLLVSLSGMFGRLVARFSATDTDARWDVWARSLSIARDYFPFGAGFGTFENVYKKYEQLSWVNTVYMNHAHQDYIEIVMEAGALGLLLLAALWLAWAICIWRVVHQRAPDQRDDRIVALTGGAVMLLFALHSLVDYPLRTPALAGIFSLSFGLLVRGCITQRNSAG